MKDMIGIDTVSFITITFPVYYASDETNCKSSQSKQRKDRINQNSEHLT